MVLAFIFSRQDFELKPRLKKVVLILFLIVLAGWYFTSPPFGVDFVGRTNDISNCTEFGYSDAPEAPPETPKHFTLSPSEVVKNIAQRNGSCGAKLVWVELWADDQNYYVVYRHAFDSPSLLYSRAALQSKAKYSVNGLTGEIKDLSN